MTRRDPRVDAYIDAAAPFAQPLLRQWRAWMEHPALEESIKWGRPHFLAQGKLVSGMSAFKAHCAFGFWNAGPLPARGEPAMGDFGRVCGPEDLPEAQEVQRLLALALERLAAGTPRAPQRAARPPRPALPVPEDLAAGLAAEPAAQAFFDSLPPGHRREYIEWITEAKQAATRARRLAQALAWLAEGKRRNWKYERC